MTSTLTLICSCLLLSQPAPSHLPLEKKKADPSDAPLARQVLQESTYSVKGSLIAAPTWLRPYAKAESARPGSTLDAAPSELDHNLAYAVFPVRNISGSPVPFECIIEQTGTTLQDTVILLYADRFNPDNPSENLVAYNDDIDYPSNKMSAFTSRHSILLDPKRPYFLVVTSYAEESLQDAEFALTTSTPDVLFARGEPVPTLGEWGLLFMVQTLAMSGIYFMRRQRQQTT